MRKIGLKVYSTNNRYIKPAQSLFQKGIFDYIEIFLSAGKSLESIGHWISTGIPLAFHAPHSLGGFNPSLPGARNSNEIIFKEIAEICKIYEPLYLVFHSGTNGSVEEVIHQFKYFFSKFPDMHRNVIIENKPKVGMNNMRCIGSTPEEIQQIQMNLNINFCLDFGHAFSAASTLGLDRYLFVNSFAALNPVAYHISDGHTETEIDEHLNLGDGNYDIPWIISRIPEKAYVALETHKSSLTNLDDFLTDTIVFRHAEKTVNRRESA
jgi:endonuclease IV